jgi:hypothetical protein
MAANLDRPIPLSTMRTTATASGSDGERRYGGVNTGSTSGVRPPPASGNGPWYSTPQATLHELLHPNPIVLFSLAFFLLGLLNNALYVVVLTSAQALLPKGVPVGLVALANIGPALVAKAIWPYLLKGRVRYARRVIACTALSTAGMLVSTTQSVVVLREQTPEGRPLLYAATRSLPSSRLSRLDCSASPWLPFHQASES